MTTADKIAALPEMPKDIERVGSYRVYKDVKYTVYDDGNSAETPYQTDLAEALRARLSLALGVLEKLYAAALNAECMVGIDGGNAEIDAEAIHALDEPADDARAVLEAMKELR